MAIEKPLKLRIRMMEATGTRPPIGTAEDRFVAEGVLYQLEFAGNQIEGFSPGDLNKGIAAPSMRLPSRFQPSLTNHRRLDAAGVINGVRDRLQEVRTVPILLERLYRRQPSVVHDRGERAPMRAMPRPHVSILRLSHDPPGAIPSVCRSGQRRRSLRPWAVNGSPSSDTRTKTGIAPAITAPVIDGSQIYFADALY